MEEFSYCVICQKKRWADVEIIEIGNKEVKVIGRCKKCGAKLIKVLGKGDGS